jgi:hypothetical protein
VSLDIPNSLESKGIKHTNYLSLDFVCLRALAFLLVQLTVWIEEHIQQGCLDLEQGSNFGSAFVKFVLMLHLTNNLPVSSIYKPDFVWLAYQ